MIEIHSPLGKKSEYISQYQPDLLYPIPRHINRDEIGIKNPLPFQGNDIWNAFEVSWLNEKGKPQIAAAEFVFPCTSPNLIESKSFKLYLNSFNNSQFDSFNTVETILRTDLSRAANAAVSVKLIPPSHVSEKISASFNGFCLDNQDIVCDTYTVTPNYLCTEKEFVTEILYSDLLKSNCLVTGQPDWAAVQIAYTGKKISHAGLLKYLVSFRSHNEFHEQCVERIFIDISRYCAPEKLCVYARYTRRGGLDINPYRANYFLNVENTRLFRQ